MGRPLLLTLPRLRADAWLTALRGQGFEVLHWPATEIFPLPDLDVFDLHARISASDLVLLPSPSAVILLMRAFCAAGLAWPGGCAMGLVGPGSQKALTDWFSKVPGLNEARVVSPLTEPFDARGLIAHPIVAQSPGQKILVLHRPDGQTQWLKDLVAAGARLQVRALYGQRNLALDDSAHEWLRYRRDANRPVAVSIASRVAGRWIKQAAIDAGLFDWFCSQPTLTHHPAIASALRAMGFARVLMHAPGVQAVADTLRALESAEPSRS